MEILSWIIYNFVQMALKKRSFDTFQIAWYPLALDYGLLETYVKLIPDLNIVMSIDFYNGTIPWWYGNGR